MLIKVEWKKYKKFLIDVMLNICATAIPLVVLQLIILPLVALRMNEEKYGLTLTIISFVTICSGSLGNALNNIRLIDEASYKKEGYKGDFAFLLLIEELLIVFITSIAMETIYFGNTILVIIMALFWMIREYYVVIFRLQLNFLGIVINNITMVIGYILGFCIFGITGYWEYIYIIGIGCSLIYIISCSSIAKEKIKLTPLFRTTFKRLTLLIVASVIGNLLNYADRLIIYPLIGGTAVSIYYASTLFGKIIGTAVIPLNSVILSYITKIESFRKNSFKAILGASFGIAIVGYVICRIIAYPVLQIIYPQLAEKSIMYVPITTVTAMLAMIISVISPFVLKFCEMRWQVIINIVVLLIYIISSILLFKSWGLKGFCIGVMISNIVKLIIMICLGANAIRESNNTE